MSARRLCRTDELPEGAARGFRFGSGADLRMVFILRKGGALYAYDNSCPHMGTPLNFLADRFLDRDGRHFLCATHGALFRIEDGLCVAGPCAGKSLRRAPIRVEDGEVVLVG